MIKKLIYIILLGVLAFPVYAGPPPVGVEEFRNAQTGVEYIRISNRTNKHLYCWIQSNDRLYYVEFPLNAYSASGWYYRPRTAWRWGCN